MACCPCIFCTSAPQPDLGCLRLPLVVRATPPGRPPAVLVVTGVAARPTGALAAGQAFASLWEACRQLGLPPSSLQIRTRELGIVQLDSLRTIRWSGGSRDHPPCAAADDAWDCSGQGAPLSPRLLRTLADVDRYTVEPKRRRLDPAPAAAADFHPARAAVALWTPQELLGWLEGRYAEARAGAVLLPLVAILDREPHSYRDDFLCRWRHPDGTATVDLWMRQSFCTLCPDYYRQWQQFLRGIEAVDTSWDRIS